jgi:hypothetical protein
MDRLLAIVDQELTEHKNAVFEQGIATAMTSILASPRFLFRTEELATGPSPEDPYPLIDEYALASRLSYFLWSSMPDDQLLRLAENNELRKQLTAQVKRMLADPKSQEFIRSFVGQWLRTQDVEQVSINSLEVYGVAREWDELRDKLRARESTAQSERENNSSENGDSDEQADWNQIRARLRELGALRDVLNRDVKLAMRQETEMLVETIVRENRDLIEIVNPGYSFLNERLAKLYGIEGVKGDEMRRVELPRDSQRGGILTQGTLLTVTSNPTRTSPVKRGLYVLENILATPTLPAPPNVPELEASQDRFGGRTPTLKELLAVHRESPLCASCHSRMDPLGLALENFNAVGAWRNDELGTSIEPAGRLVTGESFANIQELRELIAGPRKYDFYRCLSQKLLTYALGRGLEYYDEHTIDQLVAKLEAEQGTFQSLLLGIVESVPFQRQRPELTINTSMSPE